MVHHVIPRDFRSAIATNEWKRGNALGGGEVGLLDFLHEQLVRRLDAVLRADELRVLDVLHAQIPGEFAEPCVRNREREPTERELVAQDFVVRILRVERVAEELQGAGEHEAVVVARLHRRDQRDAAARVLARALARKRGRRVISRYDGHGKHIVRVDTQTVPLVGDGAGASGQISHQTGNLQISTQRSQDLQIIRSLELRVADVARFGNSREMIDNTAALRIDLNASVSSERTDENRRIAREHHKNIAMEVKKATEGLGVQTIVFLIRVDH